MDIEALMDIYRKERMSPYLQELGEDFYSELSGMIKELESRYGACSKKGDMSGQGKALKELDNIKSVALDLYGIRERKVVLSALNQVRRDGGDVEIEALTAGERNTLGGVLEVLKGGRKDMLGEGSAVKTKPKKKAPAKEQEKEPEEKEKRLVTVRIKKDLPSIVGADGKVYGDFKEEDVVSLPDANAAVLIKQGAAEEIELPD